MYSRVFVLSLLAIWNFRIYQISPNFSLIIYEMRNRDISSSGQTKTWVGAEINSVPVQGNMQSFRKSLYFKNKQMLKEVWEWDTHWSACSSPRVYKKMSLANFPKPSKITCKTLNFLCWSVSTLLTHVLINDITMFLPCCTSLALFSFLR